LAVPEKAKGFVEGHGFSRAKSGKNHSGFTACGKTHASYQGFVSGYAFRHTAIRAKNIAALAAE
jgi:hypothetical protein